MIAKATIIKLGVETLLQVLPAEDLAKHADRLLDVLEEFVQASETRIDDKVVLPLIAIIREAYNIPDED